MQQKNQRNIAFVLIVFGGIMAISNILNIDFGRILFPLSLVIVGWWLLSSSTNIPSLESTKLFLVADIDIDDRWQFNDESFIAISGEIIADFRGVELPIGKTTINYLCIAGETEIRIPENFPIQISANSIVVNSILDGNRKDYIFSGYKYTSDSYMLAENKINVVIYSIATDLEIINY